MLDPSVGVYRVHGKVPMLVCDAGHVAVVHSTWWVNDALIYLSVFEHVRASISLSLCVYVFVFVCCVCVCSGL